MKHFDLQELVDRETYEEMGEDAWSLIHPDLQFSLDGVRDLIGVPITVNDWSWGGSFQYRGYRGPNCTIGAPQSYHKKGLAADFDAEGYTAEEVRRLIVGSQDDERLILIMRLEKDVSWVHMDLGTIPKNKKRIYLFKG